VLRVEERLQAVLDDLARGAALSASDRNRFFRRAAWLTEAATQDQQEFLRTLEALPLPLEESQETLLKALLASLVQQRRQKKVGPPQADASADAQLAGNVVALYRHLGPKSLARGALLAWLAVGGSEVELAELANLLVDDPPTDDADVVQALAPLFRREDLPVAALFPRLLDALAHVPLATAVLDLANHICRRQLAPQHPAAVRKGELIDMLGRLIGLLAQLEESPQAAAQSPREISLRVQQSVALAVALCDALALIGDEAAIAKLHPALALGHRRLKTEAAAALARLGDKRGKEELIDLAAEPVARLRVLAYAKELGILDQIDPLYRSPQARAESELTVWLAEPTQFGLPPQSCELIDHRRQFWPSFAEPVDCFLFRFTYAMTVNDEEKSYTSIGIAGPLAHAFTADLADLPPADIYAAFAGWQAEHAEIKEYDVEKLSRSGRTEVARLARRLHDAGYEAIEPRLLGEFFGVKVLVAECTQGKLTGVAVADSQDILFFAARRPQRSIGIREAWCIYKGRKLLKTFNA
jgi:hypothetical protein